MKVLRSFCPHVLVPTPLPSVPLLACSRSLPLCFPLKSATFQRLLPCRACWASDMEKWTQWQSQHLWSQGNVFLLQPQKTVGLRQGETKWFVILFCDRNFIAIVSFISFLFFVPVRQVTSENSTRMQELMPCLRGPRYQLTGPKYTLGVINPLLHWISFSCRWTRFTLFVKS